MTMMPIQIIPAEVLRKTAQPVDGVSKRLSAFMKDMAETMYKGRGIGLAANQVGALERIITVDVSSREEGEKSHLLLMANPEIVWHDPKETFTYNEGCLSIPGHYSNVTRPKRIRVRYIDEKDKPQEIEAEDLLSQCIQHEIDHLNGVLFIDHISKLKRDMILRKVEKERRLQEAAP